MCQVRDVRRAVLRAVLEAAGYPHVASFLDDHPEAGIPQRRVDALAGKDSWEHELTDHELQAVLAFPNPLGWYDAPKAWLAGAIQAGGQAAVAVLVPTTRQPRVVVRTESAGYEVEFRVVAWVLGGLRQVVLDTFWWPAGERHDTLGEFVKALEEMARCLVKSIGVLPRPQMASEARAELGLD